MTKSGQFHAAVYMDGLSSVRRPVFIGLSGEGLTLYADSDGSDEISRWSYPEIRVLHDWTDGVGGSFSLTTGGQSGPVLDLADRILFDHIRQSLTRRRQATFLFPTRLSVFAVFACLAAFVLVIAFPSLSYLAGEAGALVPEKSERKIGDKFVQDMQDEVGACPDPLAEAALSKIMDGLLLADGAQRDKPTIHILNDPDANAFALPGNHIVVLRGFLEGVHTEAEVTGVLAHELGHIVHDDPIKAVTQQIVISALSGALSDGGGYGTVAGAAGMLTGLTYSRGVERSADLYAEGLLDKADIGTKGMVTFLQTMEEKNPEILQKVEKSFDFLSTHPATAERVEMFKSKPSYRPARRTFLSAGEWKSLTAPQCGPSLPKTEPKESEGTEI